MIGLVILLVLILLVLAVAFLRLGAAAGYDETGGWVKVRVGPAWLTLYPLSEEKKKKREAKAEKKAAKKKKRTAEPQENKKTSRRKTLKNALSPGGALDLALDLLPKLKEMAGDLRHAIRIDTLSTSGVGGAGPGGRGHALRPGLGRAGGAAGLHGGQFYGEETGPVGGAGLSDRESQAHGGGGLFHLRGPAAVDPLAHPEGSDPGPAEAEKNRPIPKNDEATRGCHGRPRKGRDPWKRIILSVN